MCTTGYLILRNDIDSRLSYSNYGAWAVEDVFGSTGQSPGVFAIGIPTIQTQMPTSGTASYTGGVTAAAKILNSPNLPGGRTFLTSFLSGNISLMANFASNTINGVVAGLHIDRLSIPVLSHSAPATGTMNDIALTGGAIPGYGFSGNAAAAAATAGTTLDITGASGTFSGLFNGPNAAEAAWTFSVKSSTLCNGCAPGPSTTEITVIGSFGAHK